MLCYECSRTGRNREAVGLCHNCSADFAAPMPVLLLFQSQRCTRSAKPSFYPEGPGNSCAQRAWVPCNRLE